MDFYEAPVTFWVVGLTFTTVYVALQLAINFFIAGVKKRNYTFGKINFALGIAFVFVAVNFLGKIIHNYFIPAFLLPDISILGSGTAFACIWIVEPSFRKNYFFTIMAGIDVVLFILFNATSPFYIIDVLWIAWDLLFLFQFSLFLRKNTDGGTRNRLWLMIISTDFLVVGIILTRYSVQMIDTTFVLVATGYTCLIIGLVGMYATFYHSNLFIESGWRDALEELYIIHNQLLQPLYYQNLTVKGSQGAEKVSFFSRGLIGIDSIMKCISESQAGGKAGVNIIAMEGKILLLEHSFNAIVCFVVNKNLKSFRHYLRRIRAAWEKYYCSRPIDWGAAQQEVFGPMEVIVNRILHGGGN